VMDFGRPGHAGSRSDGAGASTRSRRFFCRARSRLRAPHSRSVRHGASVATSIASYRPALDEGRGSPESSLASRRPGFMRAVHDAGWERKRNPWAETRFSRSTHCSTFPADGENDRAPPCVSGVVLVEIVWGALPGRKEPSLTVICLAAAPGGRRAPRCPASWPRSRSRWRGRNFPNHRMISLLRGTRPRTQANESSPLSRTPLFPHSQQGV